jgi:asparagine synthase (glutamine-hydrolysing)
MWRRRTCRSGPTARIKGHQRSPVRKMRGLRDKLIQRYLADRWLPHSVAWRREGMFRAPLDGFHTDAPTFAEQLLSHGLLRRTGYFDPTGVARWRTAFRSLSASSNQRTMVEMGLVGVVATQLWRHTYIDSSLADLSAWKPSGVGIEVRSSVRP